MYTNEADTNSNEEPEMKNTRRHHVSQRAQQQQQQSNQFDSIFEKEHTYKELLQAVIAQGHITESLPHTNRIYVENKDDGNFKIMRKSKFANNNNMKLRADPSQIPIQDYRYLQKAFTNISFIVQGLLAGLLLGDALYTFTFENETVLIKNQFISLPIHAAMCLGCTIACISVLDELSDLKITFSNQAKRERAVVALALWIVALTTSALSIPTDELLSPMTVDSLTEEQLLYRKLLCLTRSLSALGAWVFITYGIELRRPKNEVGVIPNIN